MCMCVYAHTCANLKAKGMVGNSQAQTRGLRASAFNPTPFLFTSLALGTLGKASGNTTGHEEVGFSLGSCPSSLLSPGAWLLSSSGLRRRGKDPTEAIAREVVGKLPSFPRPQFPHLCRTVLTECKDHGMLPAKLLGQDLLYKNQGLAEVYFLCAWDCMRPWEHSLLKRVL